MPEFKVLKNGTYLKSLSASGNVQALCQVLEIETFPDFPMMTEQGLLLAMVDDSVYLVFDQQIVPFEKAIGSYNGALSDAPLFISSLDKIKQFACNKVTLTYQAPAWLSTFNEMEVPGYVV